jgi:hypothetical protein
VGILESFARGWVEARAMRTSTPTVSAHAPVERKPADDNDDGNEAALVAELEEKNLLIANLTDALESSKTRAELFAAVLRLPGIKQSLLKAFHPDRHPNAPDADKREIVEAMAKINAAYDILEGKTP